MYFAVAKQGDAPQDGGLTQAHGPHAAAFAERLTSHGVICTVPDRRQFRQSMLEKLVWIRCAACGCAARSTSGRQAWALLGARGRAAHICWWARGTR